MSKHTCRFFLLFFLCAWRRRMFVTDYRCIHFTVHPPFPFPSHLFSAHLFHACVVCKCVHLESLHGECEFCAPPPVLCGFRKDWPSLSSLLHLLLGLISQLSSTPGQPLAHSDCSDSLVPAFSVLLSAAAEVNVIKLVIHALSLLRGSACLIRSTAKKLHNAF